MPVPNAKCPAVPDLHFYGRVQGGLITCGDGVPARGLLHGGGLFRCQLLHDLRMDACYFRQGLIPGIKNAKCEF